MSDPNRIRWQLYICWTFYIYSNRGETEITLYECIVFQMFQLPAVAPFSVSSEYTTLGQRWERWVRSLEYYLTASNITDSARKKAVLQHLAGPEVQDIFLTLGILMNQH